jgi:hypothetical protein
MGGLEPERLGAALLLLRRLAQHDHQHLAQQVLKSPPTGTVQRLEAYESVLHAVARVDVQASLLQVLDLLEDKEG